MIRFRCFYKTRVHRYAQMQDSDPSIVRARILLNSRKQLGRRIRQFIPYGVRPISKLQTVLVEGLEDYDADGLFMHVSMCGTFLQVLHAYRAGLRIHRDKGEW